MTDWFVMFVVSLFLLQHPFVTYPLSLWVIMRVRGAKPVSRSVAGSPQKIDIVFCAYNESLSIEKKIENCLMFKARDAAVEVRAYSDGSSDDTSEILQKYADNFDVVISSDRLGKSTGMNTLLRRSYADIVIFSDANAILDERAVDVIRTWFADLDVGCVCGNLVFVNPGESATANVGSFYWRLEQSIKALETKTGSTMGADGSLFAIRRHLFTDVPADIIDDMYTSLSTLCKGYRVVQSDDFIVYERSATRRGEEFHRKMRIACRAFNCHRLLWPRIRATGAMNVYKYVSHKWLRWVAGLWLVLAAISFVGLSLASVGAGWLISFIALITSVFALGIMSGSKLAKVFGEIIMSFLATTLGVYKALQGERFQTWDLAMTARGTLEPIRAVAS